MRRGGARAWIVVAVLGTSVVWSATAAAQSEGEKAADPPRATLSTGSGAAGDSVEVRGSGWPDQSVVQVQLCGNLHLNGSIDCMRANAVTKAVNTDGSFAVTLAVDVPPTPCPCVIAVATFDGDFPIDLPFEVEGAPTATPKRSEAAVPDFRLLDTRVVDDPSLGSRFGMSDTRIVASTIRNVGSSPITELPVTVTFGHGNDPSRVVATRTVRDLEPGRERTIKVAVPIDSLSAGSYTAVVTAGEGSRSVDESVSIPAFPWLLVLILTVLGITVLVVVFVRLSRSRRQAPPPGGPDGAGPAPGSFDPGALERDLADELHQALLAVPVSIRTGSPAVVAGQIAPALAATLAERHHLDATAAASLEAGIRSELAAGLAAAAAAPAPGSPASTAEPVTVGAAASDQV
ncbi:hypothetical protein ACE2AJ_19890 [Aquihabitans daechungensis]|uniref:hypothetical protein n=1 Tax=Aquihabitans daechungensis TaxID=1052257 RepID=UPI003BA0F447